VATSRIVEHVGRVLSDRYRLTRPLGTGASAHVYVAEDVTLRRRVAVKVLHPALADDEAFLRRFQAEARVVAALRHPNIVRVYDWGNDSGSPFLVMELLEGGSLRGLLDRGQRLSPAQAVRIGSDAARALDYAHRRGLVHRDIKPANLLFDEDGQVSVADFGLARALAEATWTEPVGAMLGTARYAAPEQIGGGPLDGKADVYALSLVLVEAVTGKVPFAADTTLGTLMARVDRDLPVPEEMGPLRSAVAAAGLAQPAERSDAAALAAGLTSAARQLPTPGPLTLAAPSDDAPIEEDPDLTELPGRVRLFDAEQADHGADADADWDWAPATAGPARPARSKARGARGSAGRSEPRPLPTARPLPPVAAPRQGHKKRWLIAVLVVVVAVALAVAAVGYYRVSTPTHPVPTLVRDTETAATQALAPLHFKLRVTGSAFNQKVPKGQVISQVQPPTKLLREGSSVDVVLSLGPPPVTVPDLEGLSLSDAQNRLIGAGLMPGNPTFQYDNTVPKGTVLAWSNEGRQLPEGSTVGLIVSNGPPVVAIPAVSGSFAAAQSALAAVNLTAVENDEYSNTVPAGQVIGTSPPPAASVQVGSKVTVNVSKGPHLVAVPNVDRDSVGAATQALQSDGFNVAGVTGNPINTVTRTEPPANTQVLFGSSVTLVTS